MSDISVKDMAEAFATAHKMAGIGVPAPVQNSGPRALFSVARGQKAPTGTMTTNWVHGPGGIFGEASDSEVISLRIAPRGLGSYLQALPSVETNPLFPYVTGIEENAGTEPSGECDTCLSGVIESCYQTAQFGRICRESPELEINRTIERINRGDVDLVLLNDMLGGGVDIFQAVRSMDKNTIMQAATALGMLEVSVLLQNKLVPMVWQGNPANNVGTGYKEFPGLDILISTDKVDALTGDECAALDSDVKEFAYNAINSTDAVGNFLIVRYVEFMEAYLYHNAERQGLLPVQMALCLRPELWYELATIWPIAWSTTRNVTLPDGTSLTMEATAMRQMTADMMAGMYIDVNGRRWPVITDDGIYEANSANDANLVPGQFASNIYWLPLKFLGGRNGVFFQHKDYRAEAPDISLSRSSEFYWTDDGRFNWTVERQKWCYTLSGKIEPRILLKVPQLSGRINNVLYTPLQHFRSFDQDSDYFFKGGVEHRPAPSLWSDWVHPEAARDQY
jgi:hypothetical protein